MIFLAIMPISAAFFNYLHDLDVIELNGIAIMTDTDNSKQKAVAYYQNIYFSSE